nr:MAG TPA: hypothetical protein [Caudoviricetes sp.]
MYALCRSGSHLAESALLAVCCRLRTTCFASVQFCHILHTLPLRGAVRLGCAPPRGPSCASGSRGCPLRRFQGRPGRVARVRG